MKLLIISHAYQNAQYLPNLESMAVLPRVELVLLCPLNLKGESCDWKSSNPIQKIAVPVRFGQRQGAFYYEPRKLASALDSMRPDVILHEQEVYCLTATQVAIAAARRRIPLTMFVWENTPRSLLLPRAKLRSFVLGKASGLIAGSSEAERIHQAWGYRGFSCVIPQMGVQINESPRIGRRDAHHLRVCFVGRLEKCKGVDCLLRALQQLHGNRVRFHCVIAGTGPEREHLASLASRLAIREQVEFPGQLPGCQVRRLMSENDVLVLPSRTTRNWTEQFGRVLTEAMAEATVTVGSRTGAIPEVIGSDDLIFEENDHCGLAAILERLAAAPATLSAYQLQLWRRAKEHYSTGHLGAQRVQFLERILRETNIDQQALIANG